MNHHPSSSRTGSAPRHARRRARFRSNFAVIVLLILGILLPLCPESRSEIEHFRSEDNPYGLMLVQRRGFGGGGYRPPPRQNPPTRQDIPQSRPNYRQPPPAPKPPRSAEPRQAGTRRYEGVINARNPVKPATPKLQLNPAVRERFAQNAKIAPATALSASSVRTRLLASSVAATLRPDTTKVTVTKSKVDQKKKQRLAPVKKKVMEVKATRALPGPRLPDFPANTFTDKKYTNRLVEGDEVFYKYHGVNNRNGYKYNFIAKKRYDSEADLRNDCAILDEWGIKINRVTTFKPAKGTWVSEGTAARQAGEKTGEIRNGGGYQAIIGVHNLPKSTVIRTDLLDW